MSSITTRVTSGTGATVKGSPLTNTELDTNFINLNTDKYQSGASPTFGTITANTLNLTNALGTAYGGTGLTSFTANGVVYASSTSALATGSALQFVNGILSNDATATTTNSFLQARDNLGNNGVTLFKVGTASTYTIGNLSAAAGDSGVIMYSGSTHFGTVFSGATNLWSGNGKMQTLDNSGNTIWYSSSAEQMRLTSTGLGIGTSSPAQKLHISQSSSASPIFTQMTAGANSSYWGWNSVDSIWTFQANTGIDFYTGSSYVKRMTLDSSGNLGIGTSSPSAKLTVSGGQITVTNSGAVNPAINFAGNGSGASGFQIGQNYNAQTLFVYDNAANAQRLTLDSSGNLGIGTSSPATKLQVTTGATGVQALFSNGAGTPTIAIGATATTYNTQIGYNVTSEYGYIQAVAAAGVYDDIAINPLGGNVGIGTSSPGAKLQVNGGASPTRGIAGILSSSVTGTQLQFTQGGVDDWAIGQPAGTSAFAFWSGRATGSDGTERMRLDSTGNLGLGVTPSAWYANSKVFQFGNGGALEGRNNSALTAFSSNQYIDTSGNYKYIATDYATRYYQTSGQHIWQTAPSGTAGAAITFTQAMTLDASGRLGIGTSSPNAQLVVGGSGASGWVGGFRNTLQLRNSNSSGNQSNFLTFGSAGADSSCFILNDINADGTTVNQLNVQAGATGGVYLANGGSAWLVYSDERLKTALTPFKDALQKVCTLRTGTGRYLNDAKTVSRSFLIAQDVQKVLPEAVDVQPNEQKTLGLSYTDLIPLLTAAIQEQQALIESLTTRLAALEAK